MNDYYAREQIIEMWEALSRMERKIGLMVGYIHELYAMQNSRESGTPPTVAPHPLLEEIH